MNQEQQILDYLRQGNAVTPLLALEKFGCMRLAARVYRLREQGYEIETRHRRSNDKVYAEYYLGNLYGADKCSLRATDGA